MSECCNTKQQFLLRKAMNFREYLNSHKPDEEMKQWIAKFDELLLMPTIVSMLVPVVKLGKTDELVVMVMNKLSIEESEKAQVSDKIKRYFLMFVEVATQ